MKVFYILIGLCVSLSQSCVHLQSESDLPSQQAVVQDSVKIIFVVEPKMFPSSWYDSPIDGQAESLHPDEYDRSMEIVKKAMSKYPEGFLEKHIETIYVVDQLSFYGVGYGGTNSNDAVYLANQGVINGYTDQYLEQSFHHEFSSILFRKCPHYFPEKDWVKNNKGFSYGTGGINAIIEGTASTELSEKYVANGVLCQYSMSDIEEDFNVFAEQIFCASDEFWALVSGSQLLQRKLNIIIQFYNSLDETFQYEYFRKISME